jgi:HPt (histidine-containing phosphotransfer) domain-containing protein
LADASPAAGRYQALFESEARERLRAIEQDAAAGPPYSAAARDRLGLHAHALKGMALAMGFGEVVAAAEGVESALADLASDGGAATLREQAAALGRVIGRAARPESGRWC